MSNSISRAVNIATDNRLGEELVPGVEARPGSAAELVLRLFTRGEAFDAAGFAAFFTDEPVYQFGNFDVAYDRAAIRKSANDFFARIRAVYHELKMVREMDDGSVLVEMDVHYWRPDGSHVALPCADIFRTEGELFTELRIFMDVNPVFDASLPVPESASVFSAGGHTRLTAGGAMRRFFATHPEARERVRSGFAPKWSVDGPRWLVDVPPAR